MTDLLTAEKRTACPHSHAGRACGAQLGEPCTNAHGEPMPYVHAVRVKADRAAHPRGGARTNAGRKAVEGSRRNLLSIRVSDEALAKLREAGAPTTEAARVVEEWARK